MLKPLLTEESNLSGFFYSVHMRKKVMFAESQEITVTNIRKPVQIETAFTLILLLVFITLLMIFTEAVK